MPAEQHHRLTIVRIDPQHARLRMPYDYVRALTAASRDDLARDFALLNATATRTFCKLHMGRNGWYDLFGYAADGSDVDADLRALVYWAKWHEPAFATLRGADRAESVR